MSMNEVIARGLGLVAAASRYPVELLKEDQMLEVAKIYADFILNGYPDSQEDALELLEEDQ